MHEPKSFFMQTLVIPVVFFLAGCVLMWIVRKLIFEKSCVPLFQLNEAKADLQNVQTAKAVTDQTLKTTQAENNRLSQTLEDVRQQFRQAEAARVRSEADCQNAGANLLKVQSVHESTEALLKETTCELETTRQAAVKLSVQLQAANEKLQTQADDLKKIGQSLEDNFANLAQRIFDAKTQTFNEAQEKNLKFLLSPLQTDIRHFKSEIAAKNKEAADDRISLREQVKHMSELNRTLSRQANKLTETLRLQVKQQGDWGESILESILENSGLQKGLQYETQTSTKDGDGNTIRPDVVVKYPDSRKVVIDSKVSLVHYYNLCNEADEEEQKACLKQLVQSFKAHIDGLTAKNYHHVADALDFIVMFVPVEPAYIAAMHADPELWQYAYKRGIFLISPANLIATLKLVKDMWRRDSVDKNAHNIAEKAGRLYDKLVGFVDTLQTVGAHIDKAKGSWETAYGQLKVGKGNALSIGLQLKALNIHSKKDLPDDVANQAILNDRFGGETAPGGLSLFE